MSPYDVTGAHWARVLPYNQQNIFKSSITEMNFEKNPNFMPPLYQLKIPAGTMMTTFGHVRTWHRQVWLRGRCGPFVKRSSLFKHASSVLVLGLYHKIQLISLGMANLIIFYSLHNIWLLLLIDLHILTTILPYQRYMLHTYGYDCCNWSP